jgi:hypothetical protein
MPTDCSRLAFKVCRFPSSRVPDLKLSTSSRRTSFAQSLTSSQSNPLWSSLRSFGIGPNAFTLLFSVVIARSEFLRFSSLPGSLVNSRSLLNDGKFPIADYKVSYSTIIRKCKYQCMIGIKIGIVVASGGSIIATMNSWEISQS